jgi:hypothetical protein
MEDDEEFMEDDDEIELVNEDGIINTIRHHNSKHIEIIISDTSVDMQAGRYGCGLPYKDEAELKQATEYCKAWVIREGDIPIVVDKRRGTTLLGFGV